MVPEKYLVTKLEAPPEINALWDKAPWKNIAPLDIARFMGKNPDHFPRAQAKLAYDAQALYVIFRIEDCYVRAVAQKNQDNVCFDSCAEFFFSPGPDVEGGYFNLETNCGGAMLLNFQKIPRQGAPLSDNELSQIKIAGSLPKIVDPEITEPATWIVEYRLPLAILEKYRKMLKPASGVEWRANFYKCADKTSHPHWLTWSFVDRPNPDFHVPKSFGTLVFK